MNKEKIPHQDYFYKDDLSVPAAEEYEIIARFHRSGIPVFMATHIQAVHNHHLELSWLVQQQYKYGLGAAEAFIKYPEIKELNKFAELKKKLDGERDRGIMGLIKKIVSSGFCRKLLLFYTRLTQNILKNRNRNKLIGIMASAYFWAGYRDGKKRFSHT